MRSTRIGKLVLTFLLLAGVTRGAGGNVSVEMAVDKTVASVEDEIQLQVIVNGAESTDKPEIPHLEPFDVESSGTSSQVNIFNGTTSLQAVYTFVLVPKQAGSFVIGPARVKVAGTVYQSKPITIQVAKGAQHAAKLPGFQATAEVDQRSPFVNEQITYTFRFLRRGRMQNAQLGLPEFKGFWKEPLDKQQQQSQKIVNGVPWEVTELRFALFPVAPGPITIEPATLVGEMMVETPGRRRSNPFDSFFDEPFFGMGGEMKRVRLHTDPISLNVQALPSEGRPNAFSGLVGRFRLGASLSRTAVAVGDSTTLSVQIDGVGNIRDAILPPLDLKGFKVYDDQPVTKTSVSDGKIGGSKTFKKALVPLQEGALQLPPLRVSYFDPKERAYRFAEGPPIALNVAPGTGKETLTHISAQPGGSTQKEIQVQGEDLMPIRRELGGAGRPLEGKERASLLGLSVFFMALFLLIGQGKAFRDRRRGDSGYQRRSRAYRSFHTGVKALGADSGYYEQVSVLLREYLGDKLGFDGKALTVVDTERKLKPHRLSPDTLKGIEDLLRDCDRGQYGGEAITPERGRDLKQRLVRLVDSLEKEISA